MPETETLPTQDRAAPPVETPIFTDVLCAIDGKEGGFSAVEHAAALAGEHGRLTFLAVTSFRSGGGHRGPAIGPARATEILQHAESIAREAGVPYTSEVESRSPPAQVILEWSARYDLLALGAPASSWPARMLSLGVGNKALEAFTTALLIARPLGDDRRFADRIVVASDGLEGSDGLVDLAARLAHAARSNVTLVHALGRESAIKRGSTSELERALEAQQQKLGDGRSPASELLLEPGSAADVIKAAAAGSDASLVIMGSRSLRGSRAMGRVSRRVVHQADCSVLLIPPETYAR